MPETLPADAIHVVAAIVWKPEAVDCFLISRRQKGKHLQGYWELPGGKLESGEARWDGLQRELNEEIGITAIEGNPYMAISHGYEDRNIYLDVWQITDFSGVVEPREEQQIRWIRVCEINQYQFPDADLPVLARLTHDFANKGGEECGLKTIKNNAKVES